MGFNVSYILQMKDRFSSDAEKARRSVRGLNEEVNKLNSHMAKSKATADDTGGAVGGMAKQLIATAIAATGAKSLVNFEESMAKVKAITGATSDELAAMRTQAKQLGATTEFSASQAADGMTFLGQAGFKANEIIASMPAMLDLATAGTLGLAEAADIASNIMTPFGIKATESAHVADVLAKVASTANTDVLQLGSAMKNVAPVAAAMNRGVEETAAALGVLGDAGIQAERAGTGLKIIMSRLVNPVGDVKTVMDALGVSGNELNPAVNSISTVMTNLKGKLDSIKDPATRAKVSVMLFGSEAAASGNVLLGSIDKMKSLTAELKTSSGASKDMAAIMRDQLGGDIKGAMSAVESIIVALGEAGLTSALRDALQGFTMAARGVATFIAENGALVSFIGKVMSMFIAYKAVVFAYTKAAIAWAAITRVMTIAQLALNVALIANPIGLLVVGIAAAIATAIAFREELMAIVDFVTGKLASAFSAVAGYFGFGDTEISANVTQPKVAAENAAASRGTVDGTITVVAPPGTVKSVESRSTGFAADVGMNAAAVP